MPDRRYPSDSWLTPRARVGPSPIEGHGLFATHAIDRDEPVMTFGGAVLDNAALAAVPPPYSSVAVAEDTNLLLDPAHPVRYGNHSCDPNLWHLDAVTVVARRPIPTGGELTIDYATLTGTESWSMTCRCGSPLCRQTVTGRDWRLPELQDAYRGHWMSWLAERIATA